MLFRSLVLNSFSKLQRGSLRVCFPDGTAHTFGGLDKGIQAEITVKNESFWKQCVLFGPVGFGESYMKGEWDTPDLVRVIAFFILNSEESTALAKPGRISTGGLNLLNAFNRVLHIRRPNSLRKAKTNIRDHYDLGNDFFKIWLDPTMTYSSALFSKPTLTLEEAQINKYDQLCRKLQLSPNDHLLEIGSGWGGMSIHAAKKYGCRVKTITISEEQFQEAGARIRAEGLEENVKIELMDYRLARGSYDKIVSIEMLEAVGDKYLETYFAKCSELLKPHGLLGLQMITCPDRQYPVLRDGVDFIQKHIFPGSLLLSLQRINEAMVKTGDFNLFSWEDMGSSYARTLQLWAENFSSRIHEVYAMGFSEQFIRKWKYYFAYCEAAFGTRHISVSQSIYTRPDNISLCSGEYSSFKVTIEP